MSPKIKILKRIALFLCIMMLSANCTNDENLERQDGNSSAKLKEAQKWFSKYESEGENYFLIDNLKYNWDEAIITNSEDGTETTIVPIIESKKDNREFWEQRLYIYKTGEKEYKALVYEIVTNKYVPLSSHDIDGGDFTGFVSVWDLKTGFVRAARFENNHVIETGVVEVIDYAKRSSTNKAPVEAPCVYADFGDGGCGGKSGGDSNGIPLREVVVTASSKGSPVEYYGPRSPIVGGGDAGGYTSTSGGGANTGGGGSGALNGMTMPPPPDTPIADIQKFLSCLNKAANANLTVYAEKTDLSNVNVGHAFISISQGNNVMTYGFYPENGYNKSFIGQGIMGENGGHIYNVSGNIGQITPIQLQKIISLSEKYQSSWYELDTNNCSNFATDVLNIVGVKSNNQINTPGTVASILEKLPNHTSKTNYAPKTKRTCQ